MCKSCGEAHNMKPHCAGMACGWTVCNECGSTSDAMSKDPSFYFAKNKK